MNLKNGNFYWKQELLYVRNLDTLKLSLNLLNQYKSIYQLTHCTLSLVIIVNVLGVCFILLCSVMGLGVFGTNHGCGILDIVGMTTPSIICQQTYGAITWWSYLSTGRVEQVVSRVFNQGGLIKTFLLVLCEVYCWSVSVNSSYILF